MAIAGVLPPIFHDLTFLIDCPVRSHDQPHAISFCACVTADLHHLDRFLSLKTLFPFKFSIFKFLY